MPEQVIAFTVSGLRQKYLRAALGSWAAARGIRDWHLVFCIEPSPFPVEEFTGWVQRSFSSAQVLVNPRRLGCLRNTKHAMSQAFAAGAEFAILAEEDCQVSEDALEYFTWARDAYRADEKVAAVCAHSLRSDGGGEDEVTRSGWFNPVVWGTWRDRWEELIGPAWGAAEGNPESWDINLRVVIGRGGFSSVFPVRSRSLHIGETSTLTPAPLSGFFYKGSISTSFAGARPPQQYREIPFPEHLGLLV